MPTPLDPLPTPAPAVPPAGPLSYAMQLLIGGRLVTPRLLELVLHLSPGPARRRFKLMQQQYGEKPTLLDLALHTGGTDLAELARQLQRSQLAP